MLSMELPGRCAFEALFDAWVFAAEDAALALHAWRASAGGDRGVAFSVYRASLDREERAAQVLATRA
jgi:hypothetical protein